MCQGVRCSVGQQFCSQMDLSAASCPGWMYGVGSSHSKCSQPRVPDWPAPVTVMYRSPPLDVPYGPLHAREPPSPQWDAHEHAVRQW